MKRRDFLKVASGAAGGGAAVGAATARSEQGGPTRAALQQANNTTATGNETAGGGELPGEGTTVDVDVVNYAFNPGTEEPLEIPPGTTVHWVWQSDGHNVHVDSQPDGANWEGHEPIENTGFEYEHTFTVEGDYHYWCTPHKSLGMVADITVSADAPVPGQEGEGGGGGGGGGGEIDIHEMGVPFQAHFVGIATILMMVVSLVFTFFTLKYGESPHASSPERD